MSRRIIHVSDFSRELVTNVDEGDLPLNAAGKFENCRSDQIGKMRGLPGYGAFADGPDADNTDTGVDISGNVNWFAEIVVNATQVLLAWGEDGSSDQHIFYSTDGGTNWTEITSVIFDTLNGAVTGPDTTFTITTGNTAIGDHWLVAIQGDTVSDYVLSYNSGTKLVTTLYGVDPTAATLADGSDVAFFRFPIHFPDEIHLADPSDVFNLVRSGMKPSVLQREEGVAILTGRKQDNVTNTSSQFKNIWFGYVDTGNLYDMSDLAYTNYHAERKMLAGAIDTQILSSVGTDTDANDPLPNASWAVIVVPVYDDYQEGDHEIYSSEGLIDSIASGHVATTSGGNQVLDITLSVDRFPTWAEFESEVSASRRMTHFRIKIAQVNQISATPTYEAITPFYLVKEIDITSATWAATGPHTYTVHLNGSDWNAGQRREDEHDRGHLARLWVNADFGTKVAGREIVAGIAYGGLAESSGLPVDVFDKGAQLVFSAINSANRVTPDALPTSNIRDMGEYGIYDIKNVKSLGDRLVVFGENKAAILAFNQIGELDVVDFLEEKGLPGNWGSVSTGDRLFWGGEDAIYELQRSGSPREIGYTIRDTWRGLSAANRSGAVAAYHQNGNEFFLLANNVCYVYDTFKQTWKTYNSADKTWTWIASGIDGEILACDGTDILQLESSSQTESLSATYEKVFEFERPVSVKWLQMNYTSNDLITVTIYDLEESSSYPIVNPIKFYSQSDPKTVKRRVSFQAQRIKVQIVKSASTDQSWLVNFFSIFGEPGEPDRD